MKFQGILAATAMATLADALRFNMYWDQWHTTGADAQTASKITHFTVAFAKSTLFNTNPPQQFTPFQTVQGIKSTYGQDKKVIIAIGGWGDTQGFSAAVANDASIDTYAKAVAQMLKDTGADGVDIDWEYPGGNGDDYKTTPNSQKVGEIAAFPNFLAKLREAVGTDKEISIAVPGLSRDMIAYTKENGPKIWPSVDVVNIMSYDLMNRRDNVTKHHTSVQGSKDAVQGYLDIGMPPEKANLGFAFYAKWFTTQGDCGSQPLGCPTAELEDAQGADTGKSGAVTFETTPADTPQNVLTSWQTASGAGVLDQQAGGMYYFDAAQKIFWTWDTPELEKQKFTDIVAPLKLGGVMAWSLGEDSKDWSHIKAISDNL